MALETVKENMLTKDFFDRDACRLAKALLGKVLRHRYRNVWLSALIIETEAYYKREKASHSSLGPTQKRKALFMEPGTIYMYYARGADSLNVSARGAGNAVLIKSGHPWIDGVSPASTIKLMQKLNPANSSTTRPLERICAGQTLLCRSLGLKVAHWDQKLFQKDSFFIEDVELRPLEIIQTTRLGIPAGRDEHLPYRFIFKDYASFCTKNPMTKRGAQEGLDYRIIRS